MRTGLGIVGGVLVTIGGLLPAQQMASVNGGIGYHVDTLAGPPALIAGVAITTLAIGVARSLVPDGVAGLTAGAAAVLAALFLGIELRSVAMPFDAPVSRFGEPVPGLGLPVLVIGLLASAAFAVAAVRGAAPPANGRVTASLSAGFTATVAG